MGCTWIIVSAEFIAYESDYVTNIMNTIFIKSGCCSNKEKDSREKRVLLYIEIKSLNWTITEQRLDVL